jgi:hypothetical protein
MEGPAGRRLRGAVGATLGLVTVVLVGTGCGSSLFATTTGTDSPSTTASPPTTTAPTVNGVAVGIPVTGCTAVTPNSSGSGDQGSVPGSVPGSEPTTGANDGQGPGGRSGGAQGGSGSTGWRPAFMLAPVPTALIGLLEFYSDGVHTVLAPNGWTCATLTPSQQETELVVYPANDPDPPTSGTPAAGSQGVFAFFDTTNQPQGVSIVCPFFTVPSWQQREALCVSGHTPSGEQTSMPTPDVAAVTDPAGVFGTLWGSGGPHAVSGVVIFPQVMPAVQQGDGINVVEESCSLTTPTLCPTILSDFEVREFPVPSGAASGAGH